METGERLPETQIASMPLHAVTEMLGTEGLVQRLNYEVAQFDAEDQYKIKQAFIVASVLHTETRVREPYINHLLRVSTRIISHYQVNDADVVCAALLHDSVEDHAPEIVGDDQGDVKEQAFDVIAAWFNPRVANLVRGVTNPDFDPTRDKNVQYLEHLAELFRYGNVWSVVMKFSDFTDNATGLIYTTGPKVPNLAAKYLPAIPLYREALARQDLPLSPEVIKHISEQIDLTEQRLLQIVA